MREEYKQITQLTKENSELKSKLLKQAKRLIRLEIENSEFKDRLREHRDNPNQLELF